MQYKKVIVQHNGRTISITVPYKDGLSESVVQKYIKVSLQMQKQ